MPYQVKDKTVYKYDEKTKTWVVYKTEENHAKALALFRALEINVMQKGKK